MTENNKEISNQTNSSEMNRSVLRNGLMLGIFALVSTGLIAVTHLLTKDKIAKELELALVRQLTQMVPPENYDNQVYNDCIKVLNKELLGSSEAQQVYRMRNNQSNYALMITAVAPDGYSGNIQLALATDARGKVLGVNILAHQETPGLGDKIERSKSSWIEQFDGLSLQTQSKEYFKVTKDGGEFDSLTGATITSRAMVKSVYNALKFINLQNKQLFKRTSNCVVEQEPNEE